MNATNNLSPQGNEDVPQDTTVQNNALQNDQTNDQQVDPAGNNKHLTQNASAKSSLNTQTIAKNSETTIEGRTQVTNTTTTSQANDTTWSANEQTNDTTWSANEPTNDTTWSANEPTEMMDKTAVASVEKVESMDKLVVVETTIKNSAEKAEMMDKSVVVETTAEDSVEKAAMMDKAEMIETTAENSTEKAEMMGKSVEGNAKSQATTVNLQAVFTSADDVEGTKKKISDNLQKRYSNSQKIQIARPNALLGNQLPIKRFLGSGGDLIDIGNFPGKKIVLVILRGFAGGICLACSAQTLALSKSVEKFSEKNAQIILIYPGKAESIPVFTSVLETLEKDFKAPFPIVLDVELELIRQLTIEGSLAKPTSMIVTADGKIEYVYVGKNITDRPTVSTLLLELDNLSQR